MPDIFLASLRGAGDRAGVVEIDADTAYFYLYDPRDGRRAVLGAVPLSCAPSAVTPDAIRMTWDTSERHVGVFIHAELDACFDAETGAARSRRRGDLPTPAPDWQI